MKTSKTSIWNRVLALALSVVLLVSMLPKGVVEAEEGTFGTVQGLTPGAVVEGSGAEVNVTYAEVELEWCDVDATQGRTKAGWYVGVRVLAPAGMTGQADFATGENQVTFQTKGMSGWSETGMNFWENQNSDQNAADAERYIDLWYYLDEARLLTAKRSGGVNFGFRADWDIDGAYEQTVNVKLDPEKVVLKKEGSTVYPVTGLGSVSVLNSDGTINLTGGVIQGNGSDLVTVEMGQNTYVWVEKDTAAGRNTDGWWAGIRIDIPGNVSENATLKLGSGQTLLCADNYETDGAGKKYITLWKSLNKMPEEGKEISSEISFDWNADGVFEQVVEMKVDPAKTILEKDGKQLYPIQYVELTMAITGAGSVNIDEKAYRNGDKLSVEKGKELTVEVLADNANTRPVSMQVNGKDVDDLPTVYEENTTIAVNFITEYTITVETGEGGTVTGTGETAIKNNEVVVEAGKAATFQVQANEGYTISLIEVDGVAQSVEETAVTITPEKDLTLKAEFVKLYTVKVECGENGEYKVTGDTFTADAANGNYVVKETTDGIVVEATPADTYRVESFLVNEDEQLDTPENDKGYQWTMTEVGDYTIEIAFALNRYTVEATNATIAAEHQEVSHGTEVTFTVDIPEDKNIDEILVNGSKVSPNLEEENPWKDTFTLTIVEKVEVVVVFKDVEINPAYKELFNAEDAVTVIGEGSDQPIFVFKGDATVTFASENGDAWVKAKGEWYKKNLSVQTNDVVIEELCVNHNKQNTKYALPENGIKLVFDNTVPEIKTDFDTDKIYNGETVNVPFVVTDTEAGIATVSYQVGYYNAGVFQETQSGTPSVENGNYVVPVATNLNNRDDVIVKLTAEDKAVNSDPKEIQFNIDITTPKLDFKWENDAPAPAGDIYFWERTAKIVITERPSGFDANSITLFYNEEEIPEGVSNYVQIIAKDLAGNDVANDALTSLTWDPQVNAEDPDKTTYTATIPLNVDANYTIKAAYTDVAGNGGTPISTAFVIDYGKPTGTVSTTLWLDKNGEQVSDMVFWDKALEKNDDLCFALASRFGINVSKAAEDVISGIKYVEYYRFDCAEENNVLPTISEVTDWTLWEEDAPLQYTSENNDNMRFVLYLKITDMAGNFRYISTNGLVVDNKEPAGPEGSDASAPQGAIELPEGMSFNTVYPEAVTLNISINDPMIGDKNIFSGLKNVYYTIEAKDLSAADGEGHMIEKGVILEDGQLKLRGLWETTTNTGLVQTITGTILVSEEFNSNNVLITVRAEDNAGNVNIFNRVVKIDTTNPTIEVMYDNNDAKGNAYHGEKYFKAGRVATIIVTERNFNAKDFSFAYTKDGQLITVTSDDLYWMEPLNVAVGNGDETYRVATYEFMKDADYLLGEYDVRNDQGVLEAPGFVFSDMAGNSYCYDLPAEAGSEPEKVGVTFRGEETTDFTVDTVNPVVEISYDNNDVANGKYFKAYREATITITEHNFPFANAEEAVDTGRVKIEITTEPGGKMPAIKWKHDGDVHIATISYEADGDYIFDVAVTDLADNSNDGKVDYGKSKAANDFVIDTTYEDMISQEGVENGVAYGYDAQVVPSIRIHDINLDEYTVTLTGVQKDKVIDLTDEVNALLKKSTETVTGVFDIFQVVQDKDAIYTLKLYSLDKAGNEDSMEIVFTVNRFGSVYVFEDYLLELIKDGGAFVQKVENDLIITEYNADKLVADSLKIEITVDGKPLENVEYTVTPEINDMVAVGSSGWYQYKYTISKDNFSADGVYKISISSEDATGNKPENTNYEDLGILFRVDSTRSDISSIVGLEKPIINAQAVTVKYTVFDTIGIKSIMVYVDGKVVDEITDFSADPNNYAGSFTVAEKNVQQAVRLVVEDMAGNITDTDAGEFAPVYDFNGKVTVSTNIFVRWYANKGLFWGSIGGVALAAGAVWFLLAKKKKKETV